MSLMAMGNLNTPTERLFKDSGARVNSKEKLKLLIPMAIYTMDKLRIIRKMDKVTCSLLTDPNILASLRTVIFQGSEHSMRRKK